MTLTYSLVLEFAGAILAFLALVLVLSSIRVIREDESGLVIKRFGAPLPSGRIIALNGEAGYQARLLSPGWHFGLWRWQYKVERVPMVVVEPGEIAVVVAADGEAIPPERVLARAVTCDHYQDAEGFLRNHGERGRERGQRRAPDKQSTWHGAQRRLFGQGVQPARDVSAGSRHRPLDRRSVSFTPRPAPPRQRSG